MRKAKVAPAVKEHGESLDLGHIGMRIQEIGSKVSAMVTILGEYGSGNLGADLSNGIYMILSESAREIDEIGDKVEAMGMGIAPVSGAGVPRKEGIDEAEEDLIAAVREVLASDNDLSKQALKDNILAHQIIVRALPSGAPARVEEAPAARAKGRTAEETLGRPTPGAHYIVSYPTIEDARGNVGDQFQEINEFSEIACNLIRGHGYAKLAKLETMADFPTLELADLNEAIQERAGMIDNALGYIIDQESKTE